MTNHRIVLLVATAALLVLSNEALAQDQPTAPPTPSVHHVYMLPSEVAFFERFQAARIEMNAAQLSLAEAFGLKDDVEKLKLEQNTLSSGPLDRDGYTKSKELSDSCNADISQKMSQGTDLSAEGNADYLEALPHLLKGTLLAVGLAPAAVAFVNEAKAAVSSASFQDKFRLAGALGTAIIISKDIPGFVAACVNNYKQTITYGQANKIPVPKDATDALGSL